nr:hypothetical protein [Tanacetum cinerariifolium]
MGVRDRARTRSSEEFGGGCVHLNKKKQNGKTVWLCLLSQRQSLGGNREGLEREGLERNGATKESYAQVLRKSREDAEASSRRKHGSNCEEKANNTTNRRGDDRFSEVKETKAENKDDQAMSGMAVGEDQEIPGMEEDHNHCKREMRSEKTTCLSKQERSPMNALEEMIAWEMVLLARGSMSACKRKFMREFVDMVKRTLEFGARRVK